MRCLNDRCRKVFRPKHKDNVYCSSACSRPGPLPGMDPKEESAQWRRCKEMLLEGYLPLHVAERFGDHFMDRVTASLTPEERAQRQALLPGALPGELSTRRKWQARNNALKRSLRQAYGETREREGRHP